MAKFYRLIAALILFLIPAAAHAKPPVWVIRDADSTIVLFGSVHVLDKGRDWRPKALDEALAKADDLWFEIPLDEASQLATQQVAIRRGMLPPGQSLSALLSRKDRERLAKAAMKYHLPLDGLDRLRPWMAEVTLSGAVVTSQGALAVDGVEETLQAQVPAGVARRALERPEDQIAMLADTSPKAQLESLSQTLRDLEDDPDDFKKLLDLWMKGDVKGLDRQVVAPLRLASPEMFRTLITNRNNAWVTQIIERLKGSGETVIVVGAGHLVGKGGVPALLRARGLKVEGP